MQRNRSQASSELKRARVLGVGHCPSDMNAMRSVIEDNFFAEVDHVPTIDEAMEAIKSQQYDLVLVNRMLDEDDSDGMELIRRVQKEGITTPVMLVSNFEQAQAEAVAAGAVQGFGKSLLRSTLTHERLSKFLPAKNVRF